MAAFKYFGDNYRSVHLLDADEEDLGWFTGVPVTPVASTSTSAQMDDTNASSVQQSNQTTNEHGIDLETESDSELFSDCDDSDFFVHTGKQSEAVLDESDSFFMQKN